MSACPPQIFPPRTPQSRSRALHPTIGKIYCTLLRGKHNINQSGKISIRFESMLARAAKGHPRCVGPPGVRPNIALVLLHFSIRTKYTESQRISSCHANRGTGLSVPFLATEPCVLLLSDHRFCFRATKKRLIFLGTEPQLAIICCVSFLGYTNLKPSAMVLFCWLFMWRQAVSATMGETVG